jgi:hypothetical protein
MVQESMVGILVVVYALARSGAIDCHTAFLNISISLFTPRLRSIVRFSVQTL